MRVVKVPYLQRDGEFRPQIRPHLRALAAGAPVRIPLQTSRGYEGQIVLRISDDQATFEAALELADWTRFPARIRAAAIELRAQRLLGTFLVTHEKGVLTITPAAIAARGCAPGAPPLRSGSPDETNWSQKPGAPAPRQSREPYRR